jgi:tRNA(adenine34) deaminase
VDDTHATLYFFLGRESGEIVAEGWNKSSINPTWHGEIDAINQLATARAEIDGNRYNFA